MERDNETLRDEGVQYKPVRLEQAYGGQARQYGGGLQACEAGPSAAHAVCRVKERLEGGDEDPAVQAEAQHCDCRWQGTEGNEAPEQSVGRGAPSRDRGARPHCTPQQYERQ